MFFFLFATSFISINNPIKDNIEIGNATYCSIEPLNPPIVENISIIAKRIKHEIETEIFWTFNNKSVSDSVGSFTNCSRAGSSKEEFSCDRFCSSIL